MEGPERARRKDVVIDIPPHFIKTEKTQDDREHINNIKDFF
jgi:hypothetical protein